MYICCVSWNAIFFWSIVVNFDPWKRKMIFMLNVYMFFFRCLDSYTTVVFQGMLIFLIDRCKFWSLEEKDDFHIRCIYLLLRFLEREFFWSIVVNFDSWKRETNDFYIRCIYVLPSVGSIRVQPSVQQLYSKEREFFDRSLSILILRRERWFLY